MKLYLPKISLQFTEITHADGGAVDLDNSSAIGANAITMYSNEMVLGDSDAYIGIGYSGVPTFPPGKLSVDKTDGGQVTTPTIAGFFHNGDFQYTASSSFTKRGIYSKSDRGFSNGHGGGWCLTNIGGDFEASNVL